MVGCGCGCGWMLRVGDWMWMLTAHVRMCVLSCVICVLVCILLHSYLQHRCFSISCFICNLFCDFLNTWQFLQHICCSISCFICDVCSMSYAHSNSTSTYATAYRASSVCCFVMSCVLLTNNHGAAAPLSCHSCLCTTLLFSLPLSLSLVPSLSHCLSVSLHPVSLRSCEMC